MFEILMFFTDLAFFLNVFFSQKKTKQTSLELKVWSMNALWAVDAANTDTI